MDNKSKTHKRNVSKLKALSPAARFAIGRMLTELQSQYPKSDYTITSGLRGSEEQKKLYQIGRRGIPGERIVTNALGNSAHQYGIASDIYPLGKGKLPSYEEEKLLYDALGKAAKQRGMIWGGTPGWGGPKGDFGHVQLGGR